MRSLLSRSALAAVTVWTLPWFVVGKSFASAWSFFMLTRYYGDPVLDRMFLASAIATWAVLFVASRRFRTMAGDARFPVAAFVCMAVGSAIAGAPLVLEWDVPRFAILAGLTVGGIGFALIFNLWFEFYARIKPVQVAFYLCLDIVVVEVIWWFCCQMSGAGMYAAAAMCSLISSFSVRQCFMHMDEDPQGERPVPVRDIYPWKLYAALFMYLFMSTVCKSLLTYDGGFLTFGYLITAVLVLAYLVSAEKFRMANLYRLAMPVMTAAIFSVALFDPSSPVGWMLANSAYSLMLLFARVETCYLSYSRGYNACRLFSIFNIVMYVAVLSGEGVAAALVGNEAPDVSMLIVAGAVIVVIVWTLLFLNTGPTDEGSLDVIEIPDLDNADAAGGLEELSERCGLTQREAAIAGLLLEGRTTSGIASELYIAQGTVKVHMRNIYKKTGVHSREELAALVRASGPTTSRTSSIPLRDGERPARRWRIPSRRTE